MQIIMDKRMDYLYYHKGSFPFGQHTYSDQMSDYSEDSFEDSFVKDSFDVDMGESYTNLLGSYNPLD